jgi:ABC-2 type transport system permease protein
MGEVFPLDILPMPYKDILINLPFSAGVFTPVAYLVGRVGVQSMINSFISLTVSLVFLNTFAYLFWKKSLREYTGTGA